MNRRALLAAGAALIPLPLAGCGRSTSLTETSSETPTPTPSPTPTPTPPEGFGGLVPGETCVRIDLPREDAATYPPFDGARDADAARDFAGDFELALVDAHLRADARTEGGGIATHDRELREATVRAAGAGHLVRTHVRGAFVPTTGTATGEGTPTALPAVPYDVTARYFVTGRYAVRRGRESEIGDLPEGVIACA
ncbi:MAG: hypothetical protein ABEJ34_00135 [Haloferacaceae archaeon]